MGADREKIMENSGGGLKDCTFNWLMSAYRKMFARRLFYPLNRLLFNLSIRGMGIGLEGNSNPRTSGEYRFLRALSKCWGPTPVVLDVGANQGSYAQFVREVAPEALVYAFEPHPGHFPILAKQSEQSGFVPLNVGCGEKAQRSWIYDFKEQEGSLLASLYKPAIESFWNTEAQSYPIEIITLDQFLENEQIHHVDLLKIDTEGHECKVLEGCEASLQNNRVDVIQFEFNSMNVMSRSFFRDFYERLPNYSLYRMLAQSLIPLAQYSATLCEIFAYQNIVAIRKGCTVNLS